jgi:hypothetical protein
LESACIESASNGNIEYFISSMRTISVWCYIYRPLLHGIFTILVVVSVFIPYSLSQYNINGVDSLEAATLRVSLGSQAFYTSLVASLATGGCLLLNFTLDLLGKSVYRTPGLSILFGFVLVELLYDAAVLGVVIPHQDAHLLRAGFMSKLFVMFYLLITFLQIYGGNQWDVTGWFTSGALAVTAVLVVSRSFSVSAVSRTAVFASSMLCYGDVLQACAPQHNCDRAVMPGIRMCIDGAYLFSYCLIRCPRISGAQQRIGHVYFIFHLPYYGGGPGDIVDQHACARIFSRSKYGSVEGVSNVCSSQFARDPYPAQCDGNGVGLVEGQLY